MGVAHPQDQLTLFTNWLLNDNSKADNFAGYAFYVTEETKVTVLPPTKLELANGNMCVCDKVIQLAVRKFIQVYPVV